MRTTAPLALACAGIAVMLALSGCSGSDADPTPVTSPTRNATDVTAIPAGDDTSTPAEPSLPAGIPTAEPSPSADADPSTLDATVFITLGTVDPATGGLLLGGYVSGVMEDGGNCEYVITSSSGESVSVHHDGVENNGTTSCGSTTVARSLTPAGTYTVTLVYSNDVGRVTSSSVEVVLP